MNIFSKNTFAVIVSGILSLSTTAPVLAQKQDKTGNSAINKRQAEAQSKRFRRIHSSGDKENKSVSALNIQNGTKNPNGVQKVTVNGNKLRISLRNENNPAPKPTHTPKSKIVTLPNGLTVKVLPLQQSTD